MSFPRHTEIYQSDEVKKRRVPPLGSTLAHRLDESPSRLFPGRLLSSRACLRFTGRRYSATMDQSWQRLFCQVQNPSLTRGLTPGAHPIPNAVLAAPRPDLKASPNSRWGDSERGFGRPFLGWT